MGYDTSRAGNVIGWEPTAVATLVLGAFVVLVVSIELRAMGALASGVRAVVGTALLMVVPGALLVHVLGIRTRSFGRFSLFAVGLSFGVFAAATTTASVLFPVLGFETPFSLSSLLVVLGVSLLVPLVALPYAKIEIYRPDIDLSGPLSVVSLIVALPSIAALAAISMNRFETSVGMFLFVGYVLLVVLLAATRYLPANLYPLTAFFVSFSTLLHRNLLTDHVVGADIQALYATARTIMQAGYWSPALGGSSIAASVVTAIPAAFATVTGLELAIVYKVIYVLLFAFVPLGMYYLSSDIFSENIALFGTLVFAFYHVSFYFTPGKQLISELFVILLLSVLFRKEEWGVGRVLVIALLSIGLVQSHYAATYVYGLSLLAAAIGLTILERFAEGFENDLSIGYPLSLLVGATAWYAYASSELFGVLASIPASLLSQVVSLLAFESIEGSGASYVAEQTTVLNQLNLFLYIAVFGLIGIGLGYQILVHIGEFYRSGESEHVEYTALAVPLFAFLGSSYFLIINLYADRVIQMVLVVLAPFAAVGYGYVAYGVGDARSRLGLGRNSPLRWVPIAVLVGSLLLFNSGLVFSLAGAADTSVFNPNAHDLAFSEEERAGAVWLNERTDIERIEADRSLTGSDRTGSPERVRIYTDSTSAQMFRSELPSRYYTVEVSMLKSDFDPRLDPESIDQGYVFIRERSVLEGSGSTRVSPAYLSEAEARSLTESRDVIYDNKVIRIVETGNETAA